MVVWDEMTGGGEALHKSKPTIGNQLWECTSGKGEIQRDLSGAEVLASVQSPNPGRTFYTLGWKEPAFASIAVDILPPGSKQGQGERGRGGLIFWQDDDNYLIISSWLDDSYDGGAVTAFFNLGGFEEMYDSVWSNVGHKIKWGRPYNLRVDFDGSIFSVYLDNEMILYRALTDVYPKQEPLKIARVGIVVNWEWGDDTGTIFENFMARGATEDIEQTRIGFRNQGIRS